MSRMEGLACLPILGLIAAEAGSLLIMPISCGVTWCGKKVVEMSRQVDVEKHPLGRTSLKIAGYALMGGGLLIGASVGLVLIAGSALTYVGGMGFCPWVMRTTLSGIALGLVSICAISKVFYHSLSQLKQECIQNGMVVNP